MEQEFLAIQNLRKIYNPNTAGEVMAINDMSLKMKKGEFVTIVGSNAAGKTTLFNLIAGSIPPTTGDIRISGDSILKLPEFKRSKFICRVRQNPNESIVESMTLAENLAMAKLRCHQPSLRSGVKGKWKDEFSSLLRPLNLGLERRLNDRMELFSGGQKQAVALLMATITKPKILLLDEHTAALDPRVSAMILELTDRLVRESAITTLMITHNIHHAIHYGNRLIMLENGQVSFELSGQVKKDATVENIIRRMEENVAEFEEDLNKK